MDFNIPDGDDAHLIFLPLPENIEPELEDWFVTEVAEITRPSSVQFLKDLSNMDAELSKKVKKHKVRSKVSVNVEEEESQTVAKNQVMTYFRPTIIKNLAKSSKKGWNAIEFVFRRVELEMSESSLTPSKFLNIRIRWIESML